jgi:hypothetical protein
VDVVLLNGDDGADAQLVFLGYLARPGRRRGDLVFPDLAPGLRRRERDSFRRAQERSADAPPPGPGDHPALDDAAAGAHGSGSKGTVDRAAV